MHAGLSAALYVAPQQPPCYRNFTRCKRLAHALQPETSEVLQWSGFSRPLLMRSVCTARVEMAVPGCSGFPIVFLRDMAGHVSRMILIKRGGKFTTYADLLHSRGYRTYPVMRHHLQLAPRRHPCARIKTPLKCYRDWVAALK